MVVMDGLVTILGGGLCFLFNQSFVEHFRGNLILEDGLKFLPNVEQLRDGE